MEIRFNFASEEEKRRYVHECDMAFEAHLDTVMKDVCAHSEAKFFTLSGPTCSGKTTASEKLIREFEERGRKIKIISLDDFFRDRSKLENEAGGGRPDFDSEKALDLDALSSFMSDLIAGRTALLPHFDFKAAKRTGFSEFRIGDADAVVFEGIQAIYPVFTELFPKNEKPIGIYISPLRGINVKGGYIEPREIRLLRRIVRDHRYRGASPEFTFFLWDGVTENEDKNILPFADNADYKIDSLLGYELGMLKGDLDELLSEVSASSPYYEKSRDILKMLDGIDVISRDYLPKDSIYHEFV